ncbi:hypothetical protein LguiB_013256 [Lonicera macranthoides]
MFPRSHHYHRIEGLGDAARSCSHNLEVILNAGNHLLLGLHHLRELQTSAAAVAPPLPLPKVVLFHRVPPQFLNLLVGLDVLYLRPASNFASQSIHHCQR